MKSLTVSLCALAASLTTSAFALTATSFSSFGGVEEPRQIYRPSSNSFADDSYDNTTSPSSGVFKFELRFTSSWWDGDMDKNRTDRQRAEVRQLGTRQATGQTFEYLSTWRTPSTFRRGGHFTHIFQVKAMDGNNAPPLVVGTILSNTTMALQKCSGSDGGLQTVHSRSFAAGSTYSMRVRLKASTSSTGSLQWSINGSALSGRTGLAMYRPGATQYHPKWGLYRGVHNGDSISTTYVEHRSVQSNRL